ncbi:MAG: hypothetical protein PGN16_03865 [Sphingomonas phyllosphaerae]|uniref:helix-turn-helix domain-containing protein n=1 Tax=Sphingomonas phyllosphaerae TaxID=257003 RepID=UPI002FF9477E
MSFAALAAVSKMRAGSAAEKLIALAYADRHNEETGCAYPSLAWLCEFGSLNRKTVIAAVARLEAAGFLTDTGDRQGNTKQIKVYRIDLESIPKAEPSHKRNRTESGTVPKTAAEQSQKRDTDTVREPTSPKASPSPKRARSTEPKLKPFRLPADWRPTRFPDGTVAREVADRRGRDWSRAAVESFRLWAANADDKDGVGRKLDWQAALAKWIIEQDKRDGRSGNGRVGGNGSGGDRTLGAMQDFVSGGPVD